MHEHFTDTIFYQIELTAKYCKMLGQQIFDKYNMGISLEEYTVLDTLTEHRDLCQRDLAKLILKDRANTGKLLDALERKGYITRKLAIKNNRPVKIIDVTESGMQKVEDSAGRIRENYIEIKEKIKNSDISKVGKLLAELREILSNTINIQI